MPAEKKQSGARKRILKDEVMLGIRCDRELRDSFLDTCIEMDTNASRELRSFMRSFLAKNGQGQLL